LVLFGRLAQNDLGAQIAARSTLGCVTAESPDDLDEVLKHHPLTGLIALSRPEFDGEAGIAIERFRGKQPSRMTLYHAWDYNLEKASRYALKYCADGLTMPGIDTNELFANLFGVLELVTNGEPRPSTSEEYIARLKKFAPRSPFWSLQDKPRSEHY
jgi:hypothetical protein